MLDAVLAPTVNRSTEPLPGRGIETSPQSHISRPIAQEKAISARLIFLARVRSREEGGGSCMLTGHDR